MSRRSSWVSWSDSPREQSEPSGEDTVMEDCTEAHQSEINRKIKANDKFLKILTNMPEEHRVLIHGDSFMSKMQSLDDEKAALLRRNRRSVWKYCKHGSRPTRNWKQPTPNRPTPNTRWRWWPNRMQKMTKLSKLSIRELQRFRLTRQDPPQTKQHNKPFSQCSNPFSQCNTWGATVFRNSSCRPARRMKMSRKSVRLWHRQSGNSKQGARPPEPGLTASRAKWWARMKSSPLENANLDSAKWTSRAIKRSLSCQTRSQKRDDWRRNANEKEKCCNLLRLLFWTQLIAVPFYLALSRIGEADNPCPAHAAAKLFGDHFDAIGQWAANLASKIEVELGPLFTQVGECRQMFLQTL